MFVCDYFVLGFTGFSIILESRSTLKEYGGIRYLLVMVIMNGVKEAERLSLY